MLFFVSEWCAKQDAVEAILISFCFDKTAIWTEEKASYIIIRKLLRHGKLRKKIPANELFQALFSTSALIVYEDIPALVFVAMRMMASSNCDINKNSYEIRSLNSSIFPSKAN